MGHSDESTQPRHSSQTKWVRRRHHRAMTVTMTTLKWGRVRICIIFGRQNLTNIAKNYYYYYYDCVGGDVATQQQQQHHREPCSRIWYRCRYYIYVAASNGSKNKPIYGYLMRIEHIIKSSGQAASSNIKLKCVAWKKMARLRVVSIHPSDASMPHRMFMTCASTGSILVCFFSLRFFFRWVEVAAASQWNETYRMSSIYIKRQANRSHTHTHIKCEPFFRLLLLFLLLARSQDEAKSVYVYAVWAVGEEWHRIHSVKRHFIYNIQTEIDLLQHRTHSDNPYDILTEPAVDVFVCCGKWCGSGEGACVICLCVSVGSRSWCAVWKNTLELENGKFGLGAIIVTRCHHFWHSNCVRKLCTHHTHTYAHITYILL